MYVGCIFDYHVQPTQVQVLEKNTLYKKKTANIVCSLSNYIDFIIILKGSHVYSKPGEF